MGYGAGVSSVDCLGAKLVSSDEPYGKKMTCFQTRIAGTCLTVDEAPGLKCARSPVDH